jgi:hypothetical protein
VQQAFQACFSRNKKLICGTAILAVFLKIKKASLWNSHPACFSEDKKSFFVQQPSCLFF